MFGGSWAGDMAVNGARKDAIAAYKNLEQANQNITEMNDAHAGNLGIRGALQEQLRHVDPNSPLLKDT